MSNIDKPTVAVVELPKQKYFDPVDARVIASIGIGTFDMCLDAGIGKNGWDMEQICRAMIYAQVRKDFNKKRAGIVAAHLAITGMIHETLEWIREGNDESLLHIWMGFSSDIDDEPAVRRIDSVETVYALQETASLYTGVLINIDELARRAYRSLAILKNRSSSPKRDIASKN